MLSWMTEEMQTVSNALHSTRFLLIQPPFFPTSQMAIAEGMEAMGLL